MNKEVVKGLNKGLSSVMSKATPAQALEGLTMLVKAAQENNRITQQEETERTRIKANKETNIASINAQKEILQTYLNKTFSERSHVIDEMFKALDKGIDSGDSNLMAQAMGSIVEIAKESPLEQVEKLVTSFNNPDIKRIDF